VPGFSFIVKPMQPNHPEIRDLPRMEHVIMRFGDSLGLGVAKTAFIRLRDGTDAFITRRFDRASDGELVHAEDMAQATGDTRCLGHTYNGSYEVIARTLMHGHADPAKSRSSRKRFLRATLFNYIFGNTDAHLKNHSIIWERGESGLFGFSLAPLYDIVPCLLYTDDGDELGLRLRGKTKGFIRADFDYLAEVLDLTAREIDSFVVETRAARQLLIDLARAYEVDQAKIETLFELAARRIAVLSSADVSVGRPKAVAKGGSTLAGETAFADDARPSSRHGSGGVDEPHLCRSAVCLNPTGRTRLRGRRRRELGVCSYCDPEDS